MISKYQQFIFENYHFDEINHVLTLEYSFDTSLLFSETYTFNFDFAEFDHRLLECAIQNLFLIGGVSYYKAYLAPAIVIHKAHIDEHIANFLGKTYQKGLGEFFFMNRLDPKMPITFPISNESQIPFQTENKGEGQLIGIGGGKDSLASVEILRHYIKNIATWSMPTTNLDPLIDRVGLPYYAVSRKLDPNLLEINKRDAYNGHVPISAIFAAVGVIVAILTGKRDVVVSNELSANEPTLEYQDTWINHQYSKSQEFERDFQSLLLHTMGDSIRYYSFLRPLSELAIAKLFAATGFDKYKDVFSSCNHSLAKSANFKLWDGTCPKCAFVFLILTPFIKRQELETIFNGKNLLLANDLDMTYRQLLGIEGEKPFECIGEIKESRAAMLAAEKIYPELASRFQFELPNDYDYKTLGSHNMPSEIYQYLIGALDSIG